MLFISRICSWPGQGSGSWYEVGSRVWISNVSIVGGRHHIFSHVEIQLSPWHSLCRYREPLTLKQQGISEATRFLFLQQPKTCNITPDIPTSSPIPQSSAPRGAFYTGEGDETVEGPRGLTASPGQIPPAQHPPVPHLFGTHKYYSCFQSNIRSVSSLVHILRLKP